MTATDEEIAAALKAVENTIADYGDDDPERSLDIEWGNIDIRVKHLEAIRHCLQQPQREPIGDDDTLSALKNMPMIKAFGKSLYSEELKDLQASQVFDWYEKYESTIRASLSTPQPQIVEGVDKALNDWHGFKAEPNRGININSRVLGKFIETARLQAERQGR